MANGSSSTCAAVLGLREEGDDAANRAAARTPCGAPTLLVLDNCEHVIDGAVALVDALLASAGRTTDPRHQPRSLGRRRRTDLSRCARCRCRPRRTCKRWWRPSRCASSWTARGSCCPTSRSMPTMPHRSRDLPPARRHCAGDRAGRRARDDALRPTLPPGSTIASACSPAAAARCRVTRHCRRRFSGATSC